MMRLGRFRARLTCLWLLLLDSRFLRTDLRIVWLDMPRDTTMIASRLTLFIGMLLDKLYTFKVSILTNNKVLTSLRYMSPMGRTYLSEEGFSPLPFLRASCIFQGF
jgi:hypothetical protein